MNGLDPAGVVEVRELLIDLAREDGVTVLLSSHLLSEVARIATRIGILHEGRLIEELDSTTLDANTRTRLEVVSRDLARAAEILRGAGYGARRRTRDTLVLEGRAVLHPEEVATALVAGGEPPTHLVVVEDDLEDHFMRLVGQHADSTGVAFLVAAMVGAFFMFVLQDPTRARSLGLLGAKAQLSGGTADWPGYFALVAQMVAVGGMLLFGMILIWLFGREFADRTAKDLLALPTSRAAVVAAKLVVALVWSLLLTAELVAISLPLGALLGLPGWSTQVLVHGVGVIVATACLTLILATTYALAASWGRGYLAAVATLFVTAIMAQIVSAVGFGAWFPWAVPSLMSGVAGPGQATPGPAGILSVIAVGAAASAATVLWWQRADHDR